MEKHCRSVQKVTKGVTDSTTPSGASGSGRRGTRPRQSGFGAQSTGGEQVRKTSVLEEERAAKVSA